MSGRSKRKKDKERKKKIRSENLAKNTGLSTQNYESQSTAAEQDKSSSFEAEKPDWLCHHLYQEVRPNKIFKALDFLKKTNPHFADIEIKDDIFKSGEYLDDSENYSAVDSSGADKERESEPGNNDHNESNINAECDDPDTEEEESTEESHDFAPPLDTSLQPSDLTQYYADQNPNSIFCIAPAEGNTPTKVIHSEGQAFPIYFPNGKKTYTDKRNTKISMKRVIANSTHTEEADLEEESKTETGKKIRLLHNMGTITRRTKKDAVIRYPKFSQSKDPEKYYFNLLRLYCPHRENRFLPSEYNSFQQYYETGKLGLTLVCNIVNENMKQFQKLTDQLDETWSLMKDMPPLEEAWAQVAPNSEQERMENEEEKELLNDEEFLSAVDIPEMKSTPQTNKNSYSQNVYTEPNPNTITDEKLLQMYRLLNKEQMELLNFIKEWCLQDRDDPMNQDVENLLRSRLETSNCPSDAIHIFSTNEQVRHHNLSKLHQLRKPIISMTAVDILHSSSGKVFQRQTPFENLDTCLQSELKLAMGARVMLTVNIDTTDGLVNGTLGTVIDIVNGSMTYGFPEYIVLQFDDEHIGNNYRIRNTTQPCDDKCVPFRILSQKVQYKTGYITRFQFPFTLSWACTIHKVQGQTFKEVAVSLKRVFKGGMAYVALSRVTHLEGLHLLDYDPSVIYADSSVKQSLDQMEVLSLTDSVLQPNERENNFLLLHHNVQSLRKHFPDVKKMLEFYSPNVFCATETWLGEDSNQTCYDVDGFNLESVNSVQDRGAGAAVYIKIGTTFHIVKTDAKDDYEMICIFFPKISTMVATVYRHCNASLASFLHVPQCLLDICKTNNIPKIVVLGDFNNNTGEIGRSFLSLEFQQIPDKRKTIVGFEADSFTPQFPLPYTPFMTTLYQHLGLTARVVDMWCGNNNTLHLVQWLQTVGFNVVPTLGTQQYSVSCGYVAANTAWIFHNTNNWLEVEIQPTLDKCIIHQYNSIIGIPGHEPTFLMDTQIIEILAHLHNAESSSVPFTWIDGPMPINFFILGLRRSLSGRKTRKDSNLRIAIVNTTPTDSSTVLSGDHWITVAYKLCSV
uniref:DNA helicase Pif1-like 2B domain-containing protein n=1 Tax=Magallana gigas TaxID=29159 RepID=A0A8W8LNQ3_MAGGI